MPLFKKKKPKEEEKKVEEKKDEEKSKEEKTKEKKEEEKKPKEKKRGFRLGFGKKKEKPVKEEKKPEEKPPTPPQPPPPPQVATMAKEEEKVEEKAKPEEEKPVSVEETVKEKEEKPKKKRFGLGFGKKKAEKEKPKKEKVKPIAKKPAAKAEKPRAKPVLRIAPRKAKKPRMRERGILTAEVYKTVSYLVVEGFVFGSLAAVLLYVALTGLMDSPVIEYIANYMMLDKFTSFMLFLLPVGIGIGLLASDLAIKTQKGIGLVAILSRKGRGGRARAGPPPTETRTPPLHPGRLGLAGLSLVVPATGLLLIYLFPGQPISMLAGAVLMGVGVVVSLYLFITALKPPPPLPWYVALVTEVRSIKFEESQKLAQLVRTAGVSASPSIVMARYFAVAIILSFLLVPLVVLVGFAIYFGTIALDIALGLIGIFVIALVAVIYYPYIRFNQLKGERKKLVEKDLPFFAIYASILQSAGMFIDHAFRRLIGNPLFPGIEREARILEKDIKLGKDPLEALTALALDHPSRRFKDFIFGYTSVVKSGWDALSYLSMRIHEYIQEMKFNWKMYSERAGGIGEMLVTLFLMTTTLLVLIAVVLPYGVENIMAIFNFLILPLIAIVMIMSIDALVPQPKIKNYYTFNILFIGASPFIVLIILSILNVDTLTIFEVFIISILLVIGIDFQIQHAEVKGIESALPEFLRDITEYRKIGFPMLRAFFMIKESGRHYNKHFDKLLNVIIAQLRAGIRLNKVKVPTRSWLGHFVFWLLGEIEDTGGGTPAILEEFTSLITDLLEARDTARKQLRMYNILTLVTPFFLIIFVAIGIAINNMIKSVMGSQAAALQELQKGGMNVNLPIMLKPADTAIFFAKISVLVSSLLLSITMTKAVNLTVRNTIMPAIVTTIALFLIHSADLIANMFSQMMMQSR